MCQAGIVDKAAYRAEAQLFNSQNAYRVIQSLSDDPEWPAGARASAGLVQNDGQVPCFLTAPVAGGISHENLSILHTAQNDEMAGGSKASLGHQRNH